jgi:hypothetical protein
MLKTVNSLTVQTTYGRNFLLLYCQPVYLKQMNSYKSINNVIFLSTQLTYSNQTNLDSWFISEKAQFRSISKIVSVTGAAIFSYSPEAIY